MFSVVIPAYGRAPYLQDCLAALMEQSLAPDEIIVFHTGPADPTHRVKECFPSVRVVHEESRRFAGDARNEGASLAVGDWLAFLDCDMVAHRDWLHQLQKSADAEAAAIRVGAIGRRNGGIWGLVMWLIEFGSVLPHRQSHCMLSAPSANFATSKTDFERAGGFRIDLYAAEDGEFFCRMRASGRELRFTPDARADHIFAGGGVKSLKRLAELGRAAAFLRRHHELPGSSVVRFPLLAFLLPFGRLVQMGRRLISENGPGLRFLALSPLIFAGLCAWSIGFYREARNPIYPEL